MTTSLEITSGAIRLCREQRGRITTLETWPVPDGADPIDTLAAAPLPNPLGRVAVVLHHGDMLLRPMLQPPCPADRLDRIVRFELKGMAKDDGEPVTVAWHLVRAMGTGDMRILALVTKRALVERVQKALAAHGGKLAQLAHPAVALYHAYRRQAPNDTGDAIIADIGGKHIHLALVQDGELLFVRTQGPAMEELAKQVTELRGIPEADAVRLVAKLGRGGPTDLHDLVRRQGHSIAGALTNNVRFAKTQLRLDRFEPQTVWIAGAGAQVIGFVDAMKERLHIPVRLINPFAGVVTAVPTAEMDRLAALPTPWATALGASLAPALELDAVAELRERAAAFWRTDGALRVACALALALLVLAGVRQSFASSAVGGVIGRLEGEDHKGLVPTGQEAVKAVETLQAQRAAAEDKLRFLDGERRAGRIAVEMLAAVAEQQDAQTTPVVLGRYRVARLPGLVQVELEGFAESASNRSTADVLRAFEQRLVQRYEPIATIKQLPRPISTGRQAFCFQIGIADRTPEVTAKSAAGGKVTLAVTADPVLDLDGLAQALLDRHRSTEDAVSIAVTSAEGRREPLAKLDWNARTGWTRSGR